MPLWIVPGEDAARRMLRAFVEDRLTGYATSRNDPTLHAQSDLSPYIRWGNISAQRIAHIVEGVTGVSGESKKAFLEELVVRRELAENFVYYTKAYNTLSGAHAWAQKSIEEHRNDPRAYVYTYDEFATGKTHDILWNAAQREMVFRGKMHGFMRMYWAKKILEWTRSPEEAIAIALRLNDTYELDGRDSNGVVGVMWSIAGVHDRAWFDRPIFGKIRYMNESGCRRKFDVDAYITTMSVLS
jgi:deoxyribodipyrimidine photo-lyase